MFEDYNFGNESNIINKYIDFNIDESLSMIDQIFSFKQDMLQITYSNGYIIDIGWYPEFEKNGLFKILLINNQNWLEPILEKTCSDLITLRKYLYNFVEYVKNLY